MAYSTGEATYQSTITTANLTCTIPPHKTDDYIVVVGTSSASLSVSGYTSIASTSGDKWAGAWYKKAASGSESDPVITNGNEGGCEGTVFVIRDADTTTFLDATASSNATTNNPLSPTITTTQTNSAVFRVVTGQPQINFVGNGFLASPFIEDVTKQPLHFVWETLKATAGATGTLQTNGKWGETAWCGMITFGVRNKTGGVVRDVSGGNTWHIQGGVTSSVPSHTTLSARRTSLGGQTVSAASSITQGNNGVPMIEGGRTTSSIAWATASATNRVGTIWTYGTVKDMSGCQMISLDRGSTANTFNDSNAGVFTAEQMCIYFEDSSGNWVNKELFDAEEGREQITYKGAWANLPDQSSSGTMVWTAIKYAGINYKRVSGSGTGRTTINIAEFGGDGSLVFTGYGSSYPLTPREISKGIRFIGSPDKADLQGLTQDLITQSVTVGDGATATYFKGQANSTEMPGYTDIPTFNTFRANANTLKLLFKASASCTFDFAQWPMIAGVQQTFEIDAASSTSATYVTDGWIVRNFKFIWKTGVTLNAVSFLAAGNVDVKAATVTNCIFNGASATDYAVTAAAGAAIKSSTFTKGAETYGLRITAAGAYDLSNSTFSGYAANSDIQVTPTTGTVTITLAAGQSQPSYTSAGATVTFTQPSPPVKVTATKADGSPIEGASVYLKTGATVVLNGLTNASGVLEGSFSGTVPATVDTTVSQVRYGSLATPYQPFTLSGSITSAGYNVTALMQPDE